MRSEVQIKKVEFDLDIVDNKYHNYIFNLISRRVNNEFNEILSRTLKEHKIVISSRNLIIEKIEIDINEIYFQEIDKLSSIIEKHLELKFQEIFNNIEFFTKPRIFDDIINYYLSYKIFPWWISSYKLEDNFFVKQKFDIKNTHRVLELITKDYLAFRKILDLFPKDEKLSFIKKLLGEKYFLFEKILFIKKDIYRSFKNDSSILNLEYLIFNSIQQALNYKTNFTLKEVFKEEFSDKNIDSEELLKYYDEYRSILTSYNQNLSKKNYQVSEFPKNLTFQPTSEISYFSYLKKNFNKVSTENLDVLFKWVAKNYPNKFKSKKDFLNNVFAEKNFFLELLISLKNHQLIILICKLLLLESKKDQVSVLFKKISSNIIEVEDTFLSYNNIIGFTNENDAFLKHFIRFTFLISYSENQRLKLYKKEFIYQLLLDLVRSGKLEKKNIIKYLNTGANESLELNEILSSLLRPYPYKQIPQVSRSKVYYKDLYYHFLHYEELPFWSKRENISQDEILNFFEILIRRKDVKFLKYLGENIMFKSNVLIMVNKNLALFTEFFFQISQLSLDFSEEEYAWIKNSKTQQSWIIKEIFEKKLWKLKSTSSFFTELIKKLKSENRGFSNKEFILKKLYLALSFSSNINENSSLLSYDKEKLNESINIKKDHGIISKDILKRNLVLKQFDILTYYIEFGSFPYDTNIITIPELKNVIVSIHRQNKFLLRKHLFNWSKSETRLERFMTIYYSEVKNKNSFINIEKMLSIVFTDLLKDLKVFLFLSLKLNILKSESFLNKNIIDFKSKSAQQKETNKILLKKILLFWAKYNYSFKDSSAFLIQVFSNEINFPVEILDINKIANDKLNDFSHEKGTFFLKKIVKNLNQISISNKEKKHEGEKLNALKDEIKQGIVVYNSGLLLFWPFLKTLFIKLELLNTSKNGYREEISKDKAVMATDYLVNGEFSKEKNFILNKVLCGIELNREIDSTVELADFEKAICDSAIKALLSNWKKVKSIQTLRDWFLVREGRLIEKENSFVLDVNNKPPDVFLKHLYWGISNINFDLMIKKLIVNWKY